jgi:acyl-CoA synthetase (AMP-forming)/AMP-acid ligase II
VTGSSHFFRAISLKNLLSTSSSECDTEPVNPNDPALITFTTGSTGFPKGAQRTHEFLLAQHQVLSRHLGLRSNDVDMPTLPVFVLNNLANGITSVIPPMNPLKPAAVNPALVVRQMQEFKVTTSAGSPAFFLPIAQYCLTHKIRLESVRAIFTGGAPVRPELIQTLTKILPNGSAYVVYGSTEAEPISMISAQEILNETSSLTVKGGGNCVGKPVDEIEVLIIQIIEGLIEFAAWETLILPVGEIGEIVVAGHHVNKTYYKNPDAVRENKFKDSEGRVWHRTGDTGYLDQQGRIWLIGRVKNRVRRAHQTLHPLQIEPIIGQLDFVARSALIGISDETLGQKALLIVEPREKNFLHRLRWQDHWRKEIEILCQASQFPVDEIRFHQKIPIDSRHNAKIEYATLRKQYEA